MVGLMPWREAAMILERVPTTGKILVLRGATAAFASATSRSNAAR
jgi:hypothetical protein